ncbi:hypothetical protein BBP40_005333 [Aspergillus hancockii]|nr:hypothetical protein BBP40_005333 [Aspergillus hancockii]
MGPHGIESSLDDISPQSVDLSKFRAPSTENFNLLDLKIVSRISDRVFQVRSKDRTWILKIAGFKHEVPYVQREISIYSALEACHFQLAPKLKGFVYEEDRSRVIGFLMDDISGDTPCIENLEECMATVRQLYEIGITHGDLNKYNMLITESGVKVFDFEASSVYEPVEPTVAQEEVEALAKWLVDESEVGRR